MYIYTHVHTVVVLFDMVCIGMYVYISGSLPNVRLQSSGLTQHSGTKELSPAGSRSTLSD